MGCAGLHLRTPITTPSETADAVMPRLVIPLQLACLRVLAVLARLARYLWFSGLLPLALVEDHTQAHKARTFAKSLSTGSSTRVDATTDVQLADISAIRSTIPAVPAVLCNRLTCGGRIRSINLKVSKCSILMGGLHHWHQPLIIMSIAP